MHSSLTASSLFIGPNGSGTLTKTGPPKKRKYALNALLEIILFYLL